MSKDRKLGKGLEALLGMEAEDTRDTRETGSSLEKDRPRYDTSFLGEDFTSGIPMPGMESPSKQTAAKKTLATEDEVDQESYAVGYRVQNLPIERIDSNPWQPRTEFDSKGIQELADSLAERGLMFPVLVRQQGERYQVIAGERRLQAAIKLGWEEIPARIQETSDREMAELALIENLQRQDLNPIEKALAFQRYIDEHHCKPESLAASLNMDRTTLINTLRLLKLPDEVQDRIREGKVSAGHGRALLRLVSRQDQIDLCERIIGENLSTRQAEEAVSEWISRDRKGPKGSIKEVPVIETSRKRSQSPQILDLERQFSEALDLKVKIKVNDKGRGKLEIYFRNDAEFDGLLSYFQE